MSQTVRMLLDRKGHAVYAVAPEDSVLHAIELMSEKGVGALLVMQGGILEGILSERDYARRVILQGRSSRDTQVRDIMTAPVVIVSPAESVDDCMRVMTDCRVRHLPVVEGGRVLGVLSIGDLVRAVITDQRETIAHLSAYITGTY